MKHALRALAFVVLVGCSSTPPNAPDPIVVAHITPQYREHTSRLTEPGRLVIRDAASFVRVWHRSFGTDQPLPSVDFGRQMVIVASMGTQPTGGYSILVSDVATESGTIVVGVVNEVPGPGCVLTDSPTSPVDFVLVSALRGTVEFRERTEIDHCIGGH
jgi:hypothetical protein